MKKILLLSLMFSFTLFGENEHISGYINIPTGYVGKPGIYVNANTSYALGDEPSRFDLDMNFGIALGRFEIYLSEYTLNTWLFDTKYMIFKNEIYNLSLGVDRVSYDKYISPLGIGDTSGYIDERYLKRPPELFSAYISNSVNLGNVAELTLGLGRGRFIGYGPRSRFFNTDIFFASGPNDTANQHPDFAIGAFGGLKLKLLPSLFLITEFDGRNGNAGLRFDNGFIFSTISVSKLELFTTPDLHSRVNISFGIKAKSLELPNEGSIYVKLFDVKTNSPLTGVVTISNGSYKKAFIVPSSGELDIALARGIYNVSFISEGYKTKKGKITVERGKKTTLNIGLNKALTPQEIASNSHVERAITLMGQDKLADALQEVNVAISLNPQNTVAKQTKDKIVLKIKEKVKSLSEEAARLERSNPGGAILIWQDVLTYDPANKVANAHIATLKKIISKKTTITKKRVKKPSKKKKVTTAKKVQKPSKKVLTSWYKKGVKLYLQGKYKEAYNLFKKILKYDPNNVRAKKYLKKAQTRI